jgi:light-regulated signal transduction histidine kinase (bacteriophytochrome)
VSPTPIENPLGNAWKYTCRKERAVIEVLHSGRDEVRTLVSVRDNGAGFDMLCVDQLFQPFKRLHGPQEFEGSGIGLATVHRILRRHRGVITGTAELGKGATFSFGLPSLKTRPTVL